MTAPFDTHERRERRTNRPPVPPDYRSMLNDEQKNALRNVENFGWELAFVRRPMFQDPVFIVASPDRQQHAVLEPDGEINREPDILIRA